VSLLCVLLIFFEETRALGPGDCFVVLRPRHDLFNVFGDAVIRSRLGALVRHEVDAGRADAQARSLLAPRASSPVSSVNQPNEGVSTTSHKNPYNNDVVLLEGFRSTTLSAL